MTPESPVPREPGIQMTGALHVYYNSKNMTIVTVDLTQTYIFCSKKVIQSLRGPVYII